MDSLVSPEVSQELTQILSNLVQGNNEIRQNAEQAVNERLAHTPELYLLALAHFAVVSDVDLMRSFSLVLLRRLLFRAAPGQAHVTLYDQLSSNSLSTIQRLLLSSLSNEPSHDVRKKTVDTITDLANYEMTRGRPWHALQAQAFSLATAQDRNLSTDALRESAFRVFSGCPNLVIDLQTDAVLAVFQKGLLDPQSIPVRHAALMASVAYLSAADSQQLAKSLALMYPMLESLHTLSQTPSKQNYDHLTSFLETLTPLCSSHPTLFAPHLQSLLSFLPQLILPIVDSGVTPTMTNPFVNSGRTDAFVFPPPSSKGLDIDPELDEEAEARSTMRLTALEFMISLTESRPSMVKKVDSWISNLVRACLEGMSEFDEDDDLNSWLQEDPTISSSQDDSKPTLYEQSIDRLSCALGGKAILPHAFQHIPSMLASYDWRARHAGLMAIAAIAEGSGSVMVNELGNIVKMVIPMFRDTNPRVRYAACQCVGQLCTDLEEVVQERYHQPLFAVLIPALEDPEPRVHSHAAAALINFCEGVERQVLLPYLDPIVTRLLNLLNVTADERTTKVNRYVQEQAITTLAMVADASETTFGNYYDRIMPLLLNVLRNAEHGNREHEKLRVKAMECAGLVAIAVGRDVFRKDSAALVELLVRIQKSPVDTNDTQLGHYLIATWAKICQALGSEFEPYLELVMPNVLATASAKADISVYNDEQDEENQEKEGYEIVTLNGRTMGIKTSTLEEKCQAFETLLIYCSTLGGKFAPYLLQTLDIVLPCLKFDFHEGVREASAMMVPRLLDTGKQSNTLTTQIVTATLSQLITCIRTEPDASYLSSLYKCLTECITVLGGPLTLPSEYINQLLEGTKSQLQVLAEKRKARGNRLRVDPGLVEREDLELIEQFEEFALEDMDRFLECLDSTNGGASVGGSASASGSGSGSGGVGNAGVLRIAVSSVRELGVWKNRDEDGWDGEEGEG